NGSADDTAAINAALKAAGSTVAGVYGGVVQVPKGNYLISSTLSIPNGVHLCGDAPCSSSITAASNFNSSAMITNALHNGGQEYCFISNLTLQAHYGASMLYGIDLNTVYANSAVRNCIIGGIPGVGLHLASTGSAGPYFIENNWIIGSSKQNILVEEMSGDS